MARAALKVVLVLVGLFFVAGVYPLIGSLLHPADSVQATLSLYVALGIVLLIAVRNPSAHPQPDRLHSMVRVRTCRGNVNTGTRNHQPARRISGWVGSACCHRCRPNRAGSGEAASPATFCCRGVGLTRIRGFRARRFWEPLANTHADFRKSLPISPTMSTVR